MFKKKNYYNYFDTDYFQREQVFILGEGGNKQIDKIAGLFIPTGKGKDEVKTENLDLEEMVLKLADEGVRYLKVSITVSYDSSYKDIEKIRL